MAHGGVTISRPVGVVAGDLPTRSRLRYARYRRQQALFDAYTLEQVADQRFEFIAKRLRKQHLRACAFPTRGQHIELLRKFFLILEYGAQRDDARTHSDVLTRNDSRSRDRCRDVP